jgi:hypothetical protein
MGSPSTFDGHVCTELAIAGHIDKKRRMAFKGLIAAGTPGPVVDGLNRKGRESGWDGGNLRVRRLHNPPGIISV